MSDWISIDEWSRCLEMERPGIVFQIRNADGQLLTTHALFRCPSFHSIGSRRRLNSARFPRPSLSIRSRSLRRPPSISGVTIHSPGDPGRSCCGADTVGSLGLGFSFFYALDVELVVPNCARNELL